MKLIENFEAAVRVHEMKGAAHPDDHERIQKEYENAKHKLLGRIRTLKAAAYSGNPIGRT